MTSPTTTQGDSNANKLSEQNSALLVRDTQFAADLQNSTVKHQDILKVTMELHQQKMQAKLEDYRKRVANAEKMSLAAHEKVKRAFNRLHCCEASGCNLAPHLDNTHRTHTTEDLIPDELTCMRAAKEADTLDSHEHLLAIARVINAKEEDL